MDVSFTTDAADALARAEHFLHERPVEHNLILTLLHVRAQMPQDGRYWLVEDGNDVVGVAFQSPLTFSATVTPMAAAAADAAAEAVAAGGAELPGVIGDAATASRFAGRWTETRKVGARPTAGQRLYQLEDVPVPTGAPGSLRVAVEDDVPLLIAWMHAFNAETGEHGSDPAQVVPLRVAAEQFYLWDHKGSASMAAATPPVAGVSRVQAVYTPPHRRRRGNGGATVGTVSRRLAGAGLRCILYTDLANPTSNSIYRRLGYRSCAEIIRYTFG